MTAAADVDTDNLTDLDWDVVLPCEYSLHYRWPVDQPATWIMRTGCPECEAARSMLICDLDRAGLLVAKSIHCLTCHRDVIRPRWRMQFLPIDGSTP